MMEYPTNNFNKPVENQLHEVAVSAAKVGISLKQALDQIQSAYNKQKTNA